MKKLSCLFVLFWTCSLAYAMESQVPIAINRIPLNLAIVLDVSGSMIQSDRTQKSRLEWSKDMVERMIDHLTDQDVLSIVTFHNDADTLMGGQRVTYKPDIKNRIRALHPGGTSDLYAGLKRGYDLVSWHCGPNFENRLILISDDSNNTGCPNSDEMLAMISEFAEKSIGLTTIAVGRDFTEEFIDRVKKSRGGNYILAQSGQEMMEIIERLDFLVSPLANNGSGD